MKGREKVEVCRQSEDIAAVLRECKIFSGMSEQTALTLLSIPPMTFAAGERIAGGETFSPCLGVILSGKASIYGRNSGRKVLLNRLSRGDVFGAASVFFEEHESVSTVVAGTKCRVLFIERLSRPPIDQSRARGADLRRRTDGRGPRGRDAAKQKGGGAECRRRFAQSVLIRIEHIHHPGISFCRVRGFYASSAAFSASFAAFFSAK